MQPLVKGLESWCDCRSVFRIWRANRLHARLAGERQVETPIDLPRRHFMIENAEAGLVSMAAREAFRSRGAGSTPAARSMIFDRPRNHGARNAILARSN